MRNLWSLVLVFSFTLGAGQEILQVDYVRNVKLDDNYEIKIFGEGGKVLNDKALQNQFKDKMK